MRQFRYNVVCMTKSDRSNRIIMWEEPSKDIEHDLFIGRRGEVLRSEHSCVDHTRPRDRRSQPF